MGCIVCKLDATEANGSGILITEYDLPDAVKSDGGTTLDRAGVDNELFDDPTWSISWVFTGTASAQAASVNALARACVPGATLTWKETGMSSSLTTVLRTVNPANSEHHGGFSKVTYTGTREPFWEGATVTCTASTDPDWIGTGTLNYDGSAVVVGGEVSARPTVLYTVSGACSSIGIAFAAYDACLNPLQEYTGSAQAEAENGSAVSVTSGSAAYQDIGTASALSITGKDAGRKLVWARVKGKSTTSFKARVRMVGASISASSTLTSDPAMCTASGTFEVLALGPITIPAGLSGMTPYVQMAFADTNASATDVIYLDHVTYFPLEHACIVDTTTAAAQGIYIFKGVAYLADADGKASISQDGVTFYGSWGVPCGSTVRFVCIAKPTADAAPPSEAGTFAVSYVERYVHRVYA